ncbi:MAG: HAMP domain-containing sensor histidine kinase [Pseudomonadota bacterium]
MTISLPPFTRTATFRLAVLYALLFTIFSAGLLLYLYAATVQYTRYVADQRVNAELDSIQKAFRDGGLPRVNQSLIERASIPDRYFLYQLTTPTGLKLSGDLSGMPAEGLGRVEFPIDAQRPDGSLLTIEAEGRIVRLGEDALLMVAFDAQQRSEVTRRITQAVWVAFGIGLALALGGGVIVSRWVNRRAEELASTAEAVIGGDLHRRARVRGANDEFDRLAERMNAMLERLERLVKASKHTGDSIAHDLRSPLSKVRNQLESTLTEAEITPEMARNTLTTTLGEVDRVLATFNAILRLSSAGNASRARMVKVDVAELLEELAELFEPAAESVGLTLKAERPRSAIVLADKPQLAQAMSNLIDNAIKYTPTGGYIALNASVDKDAKKVDLIVIDSGPGIPETARGQVVERFVRMDSARTLPGSGLGLALVETVADVHRGEFLLLDGRGPPDRPGLRAILRLPLA